MGENTNATAATESACFMIKMIRIFLSGFTLAFLIVENCQALRCFSCNYQSRGIFRSHPCQYDMGNGTEYQQTCSAQEQFCKTETVKSGGRALTRLQRSCSSSCRSTSESCFYNGLGLIIETCVRCCQTDNCNSQSIFNRAAATPKRPLLPAAVVSVAFYFLFIHAEHFL